MLIVSMFPIAVSAKTRSTNRASSPPKRPGTVVSAICNRHMLASTSAAEIPSWKRGSSTAFHATGPTCRHTAATRLQTSDVRIPPPRAML